MTGCYVYSLANVTSTDTDRILGQVFERPKTFGMAPPCQKFWDGQTQGFGVCGHNEIKLMHFMASLG